MNQWSKVPKNVRSMLIEELHARRISAADSVRQLSRGASNYEKSAIAARDAGDTYGAEQLSASASRIRRCAESFVNEVRDLEVAIEALS